MPALGVRLLVAALAFGALVGCGRRDDDRIADCAYIRLKQNPTTLDPALIVDLDGARIAAKIFNGLVTFDDHLNIVPDLALSWATSADGCTYTFHLRQGAQFSNGREIKAEDFRYSFERVLHPATRSPRTWVFSRLRGAERFMAGQADHVDGIEAVAPYVLRLVLQQPYAPFLSLLGLTTASVVPREEVERWGPDFGFRVAGSGPFVLAQWQHNQGLLLNGNAAYFGQKPLLAAIYYKIIPEDFSALVEFEKGGLDLLPEVMPAEYRRFLQDPIWQPCVVTGPGLNIYYLGLNCQVAPFNDVRVRRALNLAVDRTSLQKTLLPGRAELAAGPVPPLLRTADPPGGYPYDPAAARRLLQEAGYANGFALTIYQAAESETLDICQVVQSFFGCIGIEARIEQLEWSSFLEVVAAGKAQAFWLSWWADYPDQENFLVPLFHSRNWGSAGNRSRFRNERIDSLLDKAVSSFDENERNALYRQIEAQVVDDAPWVFFWHKALCAVHRPELRGYRPTPLAVMEKGTALSRQDLP